MVVSSDSSSTSSDFRRTAMESSPEQEVVVDEQSKHLKDAKDLVSVGYRLDSGTVVEVVGAKADVASLVGPFGKPAVAA